MQVLLYESEIHCFMTTLCDPKFVKNQTVTNSDRLDQQLIIV